MLTKVCKLVTTVRQHAFVGRAMQANQSRGISTYASERFTEEWSKPSKQEIAKAITLETIVPTPTLQREEVLVQPPLPPGKIHHPAVVYAMGATYGKQCAVDKINAICPEHFLLMRSAIGVARNPEGSLLEVAYAIAEILAKDLSKVDSKTLESLFQVGSNVNESRSKDVLGDHSGLVRILNNARKVPPQQLLRVLEVVLSPLGMLANAHGGQFDKIEKAKKDGKDIGNLDAFMQDMMQALKQYHVPYIKAPGSPYAHLQMEQYMEGAQVSDDELVTINHFLECCSSGKGGNIPPIPQLRSVVVRDQTGRTIHLHDHLNLPHFFDVSGTTGAVMQAALGLLSKGGKSDLVKGPEATVLLGMLLAGVNFYKQGYHNFYEVLPALNWVNHHIWDIGYVQQTPTELVRAVPEVLTQCVNPSSKMAPLVCDAMALATEHFELHHELYKEDIKAKAKAKMQQQPTPIGSPE
ncbi:hypothetical protein [Legionella fallonii]|uniref:Uncharacterized protein n=1 Tax=Legionella fallonii LLAP-10 TaxID=1212491 RepID=A0A098G9K4_9GAMM|nr:hypothetical protein [Legionella fallonii]CEG58669.1 conserved protein of unknown function [Legionella fallonii LLAP-10]